MRNKRLCVRGAQSPVRGNKTTGAFPIFALLGLGCMFFLALSAETGEAKTQLPPVYKVAGRAKAVKNNFAKAREKAVASAMRQAVKSALQKLVDAALFQPHRLVLEELLSQAPRYVKSYRFLDFQDDPSSMVSRVTLEVTLYAEALRKKLMALQVLTGPGGKETVVVLIKETGFSLPEEPSFWDYVPISETALVLKFMEAGVQTLSRGALRGLVDEESIANALQGDIASAVNIGLKAGADTVVIGRAVSSRAPEEAGEPDLEAVRVNMSLKAVSTASSAMIAAKSEFASASGTDVLGGELEAFDKVTAKLSGFFVDAIQRFREKKSEPSSGSAVSKPPASPLSITDL